MTDLNETMREAAQLGTESAGPLPPGPAATLMTSPPAETPSGSALDVQVRPPMKPAGRWAVFINYDPEKGTREADFNTKTEEYVKRFQARESFKPTNGDATRPDFEGVMMEPVYERRRFLRWKPTRVSGLTAARQFFESDAGRKKRFIEQFGIDEFGDPTVTSGRSPTALIDQEFVPLLAGPFYKQLYLYDYLLMHARAFQLVNHSALAAAAIKIMQRFTIGRGISFHIKDDQARKIWEEFWERNKLRKHLRTMAWDLPWQGELLLRYYEPKQGYMTVRVLDASTCWEVVTDPEDVEEVYYYHFQWPTPYQIWVQGNIPVSKYIVQQVPPTNVQHVRINSSAQERRGRSSLLPGMAWLKRVEDFFNGQTVKALLEANLVWKIKVKGDQADVDAFLSNPAFTELPPPGGMWIENEAVDLTVQSATMTAARGATGIGQQLANMFATSLNLPSEYFNIEGAAASRATALVRTDPAVKAIEDQQQLFREEILGDMYDRVMTAALIAGRISRQAVRAEPDLGPGEDDAEPLLLPAGAGSPAQQAELVRLR